MFLCCFFVFHFPPVVHIGGTALRMSRLRPKVPIIAVCDDLRVARGLALVWGVYPLLKQPHEGDFDMKAETDRVAHAICNMGFASPASDMLTVTAGLPWGPKSTTNVIRVAAAAGSGYWYDDHGNLAAHADAATTTND
jgi:pyruvate kinase